MGAYGVASVAGPLRALAGSTFEVVGARLQPTAFAVLPLDGLAAGDEGTRGVVVTALGRAVGPQHGQRTEDTADGDPAAQEVVLELHGELVLVHRQRCLGESVTGRMRSRATRGEWNGLPSRRTWGRR